jgi:hypothetical protein
MVPKLCDFAFKTLEPLISCLRLQGTRLCEGLDTLKLDCHRLQFAFEAEDGHSKIIELRKSLRLQAV